MRINGATGQRTVLYSVVYGESTPWSVCAAGVHTDGTIFVIRCSGDWRQPAVVIGIDPDTGAQKFSVPAGEAITGEEPYIVRQGGIGTYGSSVIVAGDGYAYVPYGYQVSPGALGQPCQNHLKLLRIDSSGASGDMAILDWTDSCMAGFSVYTATITNADTGILLSWSFNVESTGKIAHGMAVTAGTSVTALGAPGVANQIGFAPTVQTQDGWLVGEAADDSGNPYLLAIDASGSVHWAVSGLYQPKMATADGGVIATAADRTPVIFDQTGTVTGQLAGLPVQGWTGNSYQLGSVQLLESPPIAPAMPPYWSFAGANHSGSGTSPLCHDERDQLIAQYAATVVPDASYRGLPQNQRPRFAPNCLMLTRSAHATWFTFAEINKPGPLLSPQFNWAWIKLPLVVPGGGRYGLDKWRLLYGGARTITSGYRNPVQNAQGENPGAPGSRHQFGDAVDFQNVSHSQPELDTMNRTAREAGASYIEDKPTDPCVISMGCAHADWRYVDRNRYAKALPDIVVANRRPSDKHQPCSNCVEVASTSEPPAGSALSASTPLRTGRHPKSKITVR